MRDILLKLTYRDNTYNLRVHSKITLLTGMSM